MQNLYTKVDWINLTDDVHKYNDRQFFIKLRGGCVLASKRNNLNHDFYIILTLRILEATKNHEDLKNAIVNSHFKNLSAEKL